MRRFTAFAVVLLLSVGLVSDAQTVTEFEDLAQVLKREDTVRIEEQSGAHLSGKVMQIAPAAIVIELRDRSQLQIVKASVREVAVRRRDPLKNGVAWGFGAAYTAACGQSLRMDAPGSCALPSLVLGGVGAAIGAGIDALIAPLTVVYLAERRQEGTEAEVPLLRHTVPSADPFADLPLLLNIGDHVGVEDRSGQFTWGRVSRLLPGAIGVQPDDSTGQLPERQFGTLAVESIRVRGDSLRSGLAIGFVSGAAFGCAAFGNFSGEFRTADCEQAALFFGAAGAGIGMLLDAAHEGTTVVYRAPGARVAIAPILSPWVVGVHGNLRW